MSWGTTAAPRPAADGGARHAVTPGRHLPQTRSASARPTARGSGGSEVRWRDVQRSCVPARPGGATLTMGVHAHTCRRLPLAPVTHIEVRGAEPCCSHAGDTRSAVQRLSISERQWQSRVWFGFCQIVFAGVFYWVMRCGRSSRGALCGHYNDTFESHAVTPQPVPSCLYEAWFAFTTFFFPVFQAAQIFGAASTHHE